MQSIILFVIIILLSALGALLNRFLFKINPVLILFPILSLLSLIGVSFYFAWTVNDLGGLVYVIYLIILIPIAIVVGVDAIIIYLKHKRAVH